MGRQEARKPGRPPHPVEDLLRVGQGPVAQRTASGVCREGVVLLEDPHPPAGEEEVAWPDGAAEEDVVVEVEEPPRQAGDAVQVHLDGVRVEGGEHPGIREDLLVPHEVDPGIGTVEPAGHLAVGQEVDPPDPGGVGGQRSERVPELSVVAEAAADGAGRVVLGPGRGMELVGGLEGRIAPVHPGDHGIDGIAGIVAPGGSSVTHPPTAPSGRP